MNNINLTISCCKSNVGKSVNPYWNLNIGVKKPIAM